MRTKNHQRVQYAAAVFLILAALAILPTAFILASYADASPAESAACCCGTAEPLCSSDCSVEESADPRPFILLKRLTSRIRMLSGRRNSPNR